MHFRAHEEQCLCIPVRGAAGGDADTTCGGKVPSQGSVPVEIRPLLVQYKRGPLIIQRPRGEARKEALAEKRLTVHRPDNRGHVSHILIADLELA
jgi:hypothetical protein